MELAIQDSNCNIKCMSHKRYMSYTWDGKQYILKGKKMRGSMNLDKSQGTIHWTNMKSSNRMCTLVCWLNMFYRVTDKHCKFIQSSHIQKGKSQHRPSHSSHILHHIQYIQFLKGTHCNHFHTSCIHFHWDNNLEDSTPSIALWISHCQHLYRFDYLLEYKLHWFIW